MMGKPDNESLDISMRLKGVDQIFEVTSKPLYSMVILVEKSNTSSPKIKTMERVVRHIINNYRR